MPAMTYDLLERPMIGSDLFDQIQLADNAALNPPPRREAAVRSMNAAFIRRTGGTDVIEYGELPRPVPAPGQVLIQVAAAAVNPIDIEIRSGALAMPLRFPYVIGSDLAGTVVLRGFGVRRFSEGDRVWGANQGLFGRQGTFAEYVAVDEKWLYPTPTHQSDGEAAAGATVGISACLGLFRAARLRASDLVFVHEGAGGIGSAIVQQAKAAGARVITTAGDPLSRAYCVELKADLVVDEQSPDFADQIRAFAQPAGGVDVWIETRREPAFERTCELMATGGRIVLMTGVGPKPEVPVSRLRSANLSLVGISMANTLPDVQRQCAMALNARYTYGSWRPRVARTFSLSEAAAAQEMQEASTIAARGMGKIIVVPD
jgi:NADPH2:quinone reductase